MGGIPQKSPQLHKISLECASISSELQRLIGQVDNTGTGDDDESSGPISSALHEEVIDIRNRLMSVQLSLSQIYNRTITEELVAIKMAVLEIIDGLADSDDDASIQTFYTASSIPYVETAAWKEVERSLRAHFPEQSVRDNYAMIIETIETAFSANAEMGEGTSPVIVAVNAELTQMILPEEKQRKDGELADLRETLERSMQAIDHTEELAKLRELLESVRHARELLMQANYYQPHKCQCTLSGPARCACCKGRLSILVKRRSVFSENSGSTQTLLTVLTV